MTFNERRHYSAVLLEHLVLAKYAKKENRDIFSRNVEPPRPGYHRGGSFSDDFAENEAPKYHKLGGISWWDPPENSLFTQFFKMSGLHGLKYLVEPKRHLCERILWGIIFLIGVGASAFLISDVWRRYNLNPVIVSFLPDEVETKNIPFPAVTICNINKFPKSQLEEIFKTAQRYDDWDPEVEDAKKGLKYIENICAAQSTFAQSFGFAANRATFANFSYSNGEIEGEIDNGRDPNDFTLDNSDVEIFEIKKFLIEKTIPCEEQIRLCIFSQTEEECGRLFKPIVTAHGKCCSFNLMPIDLLLKTPYNLKEFNGTNGKMQSPQESPEDIERWKEWNYEQGFILDSKLKRPRSQRRAGSLYGLNILLDANTHEYFCPSADSQGFRLQIHNSLEFPHVDDYGLMIELGKELYLEIEPELTVADPNIEQFDVSKRLCYFAHEKHLEFFVPYSFTNCFDECISNAINNNCSCVQYFMPKDKDTRICSTDPNQEEAICVQATKRNLLNDIISHEQCKYCDSLCSDITYKYSLSESSIQKSRAIWTDVEDITVPHWANNNVSILHIYFGSTSTVPKYRKELYGVVDLIANTGGLLGLSLGFSVLSAVEFIYFFTCRPYCMRRRQMLLDQQRMESFEDNNGIYVNDDYFNNGIHPLHPPYRHRTNANIEQAQSNLTSVYIN